MVIILELAVNLQDLLGSLSVEQFALLVAQACGFVIGVGVISFLIAFSLKTLVEVVIDVVVLLFLKIKNHKKRGVKDVRV